MRLAEVVVVAVDLAVADFLAAVLAAAAVDLAAVAQVVAGKMSIADGIKLFNDGKYFEKYFTE
jgi:hypothetical protein